MPIFQSKRTQEEVEKLYNEMGDYADKHGSKYPGESYEEGFKACINFLEGEVGADEIWE